MKLDLLTNATVVDDAIRFILNHNNDNSDNEKQKHISNHQARREEKEDISISWPIKLKVAFSLNLAKRDDAVPFNLEEELKKIGAEYSKANKPFEVHVIEDGRLITGQNPGSARAVAEAVIKKLKTQRAG